MTSTLYIHIVCQSLSAILVDKILLINCVCNMVARSGSVDLRDWPLQAKIFFMCSMVLWGWGYSMIYIRTQRDRNGTNAPPPPLLHTHTHTVVQHLNMVSCMAHALNCVISIITFIGVH